MVREHSARRSKSALSSWFSLFRRALSNLRLSALSVLEKIKVPVLRRCVLKPLRRIYPKVWLNKSMTGSWQEMRLASITRRRTTPATWA